MKSKTKAKLRFFPVITNQELDITTGDFHISMQVKLPNNIGSGINKGISRHKTRDPLGKMVVSTTFNNKFF